MTTCYKSKHEIIQDVNNMTATGTFPLALSPNTRERSKYIYRQLVIVRNIPMYSVEDELFREYDKYQERFRRQYFQDFMHSLVQVFKSKITNEMKMTRGAILHYGWTDSGTHYLRLFACYVWDPDTSTNSTSAPRKHTRTPILSMIPLAFKCDCKNDCACTAETSTWDAKTHVHRIREVFDLFSIDISTWMSCQIADNNSINRSVARMLRIPHVGCMSHKLNLDVERMITLDLTLKTCMDTICDTMKFCECKLCHRALLRKLATLEPILSNKTRWSRKCLLLERFCRIFDSLRNVLLSQEPKIGNVLNPEFKTNAA